MFGNATQNVRMLYIADGRGQASYGRTHTVGLLPGPLYSPDPLVPLDPLCPPVRSGRPVQTTMSPAMSFAMPSPGHIVSERPHKQFADRPKCTTLSDAASVALGSIRQRSHSFILIFVKHTQLHADRWKWLELVENGWKCSKCWLANNQFFVMVTTINTLVRY